MLDEIDGHDLSEQIDLFENKLQGVRSKAKALLAKTKSFETHNDKLPDILNKFREITELFESGYYKKMIVGELEKNYMQINEMSEKLTVEQLENGTLKHKLVGIDSDKSDELDLKDFEYI